VLSGRGLCDELITRPESPTECGVTNECYREGQQPESDRRAAEKNKIK
jgi:hypothetical protein